MSWITVWCLYNCIKTMASKAFTCNICQKDFKRKSDLQRHQRTVHGGAGLTCQQCGTSFSRADNYLRHNQRHQTKLHYVRRSHWRKPQKNILRGYKHYQIWPDELLEIKRRDNQIYSKRSFGKEKRN